MTDISQGAWQVFFNVVGGAIVASFAWLIPVIKRRCRRRSAKIVFGQDISEGRDFSIIYSRLELRDDIYDENQERVDWPFRKERELPLAHLIIRSTEQVSSCDIRAANFVAQMFKRLNLGNLHIRSDTDTFQNLDFSFISFGTSNYKSLDVMTNDANVFLRFNTLNGKPRFHISKDTRWDYITEPGYGYGLILRVTPSEFPRRVWIACMGFGEPGTLGATYFLTNKWPEIIKKAGWKIRLGLKRNFDFAAVVRISAGKYESAKLLDLFTSREQIESSKQFVRVYPEQGAGIAVLAGKDVSKLDE